MKGTTLLFLVLGGYLAYQYMSKRPIAVSPQKQALLDQLGILQAKMVQEPHNAALIQPQIQMLSQRAAAMA